MKGGTPHAKKAHRTFVLCSDLLVLLCTGTRDCYAAQIQACPAVCTADGDPRRT